jgi:hypothetical protein
MFLLAGMFGGASYFFYDAKDGDDFDIGKLWKAYALMGTSVIMAYMAGSALIHKKANNFRKWSKAAQQTPMHRRNATAWEHRLSVFFPLYLTSVYIMFSFGFFIMLHFSHWTAVIGGGLMLFALLTLMVGFCIYASRAKGVIDAIHNDLGGHMRILYEE